MRIPVLIRYYLSLSVVMLLAVSALGQTGINYQAIARDASGSPLKSVLVSVDFTLRDGGPGGTVVFTENISPTTNQFGLFTHVIGSVNVAGFIGIDWNGPVKYLEVEIDGTSVGNLELQYVPYALRSETTVSIKGMDFDFTGVADQDVLVYSNTNSRFEIGQAVLGAENGLSVNSGLVGLGGTLNSDAIIDGGGQDLEFGGTLNEFRVDANIMDLSGSEFSVAPTTGTAYLYLSGSGRSMRLGTSSLASSFQYYDGNQGTGKVLTSDANGRATWEDPAAGPEIADTDGDTYITVERTADSDSISIVTAGDEAITVVDGRTGFGDAAANSQRVKIEIPNTNSDLSVGLRVNQNYAGASQQYGIYQVTSGDGTGIKNGIRNLVTGAAGDASVNYGIYNGMTPSGTGTVYGSYNNLTNAGTGQRYGTYNYVRAGATNGSIIYGTRTLIDHDGSGDSYGAYLSQNGSGAGTQWGLYTTGEDQNYMGGNLGLGTNAPVNKLDVEGGIAIGSAYSGTSTAPAEGIIVEGTGGFGTATPLTSASVEIDNTTTNKNYGLYVDQKYSGASTRYGIRSVVSNAGDGQGYGIYSTISQPSADPSTVYGIRSSTTVGTGVGYGFYTNVGGGSGSTANVTGFRASMTSSTGGTEYGVYITGEESNYFQNSVGIGTSTNTQYQLEVDGGSNAGEEAVHITSNDAWGTALSISNTDDASTPDTYNMVVAGESHPTLGDNTFALTQGTSSILEVAPLLNIISLSPDLNMPVGVHTRSPSQDFSVNGTAGKVGGGVWSAFSDERWKQDISPFEDGLAQVLQIDPVSFRYNEKSCYKDTSSTFIGVLAQDIQKVAPYTVHNSDNKKDENGIGYLEYDGSSLTYMLVNAIKDLNAKVEVLEADKAELIDNKSDPPDDDIGELRRQLEEEKLRTQNLESQVQELRKIVIDGRASK